ncbi:hypothetical protein ACLOJK_014959, partial [Asimina triloba]
ILTICLPTGSASKGANVVSGRVAKPVTLVEGGVVEAVVPDSDEGSGYNSSVEQHVPTGGDHLTTVGEAPSLLKIVPERGFWREFFWSRAS